LRYLRRFAVPTISIAGLLVYVLGAAPAAINTAVPLETGTLLLAPRDTYLNTNKKNFSTSTTVTASTWPDFKPANAILMKFDFSTLPAGAVVTGATLHMALVASDSAQGTYAMSAHKVVGKNADVAKATGYSFNGVGSWTANNCCSGGTPLAQADLSLPYDIQDIDRTAGYKAWTLTTMVQEWLLNPSSNFGLVLNADKSKPRDRYRTFASMEYANVNLRPYLKLTYAAADVLPPSVNITSPVPGTVAGLVALAANASDNAAVAGVQFHVNGVPACAEQSAAPYLFNWDSTSRSDGTYAITAVARDTSGNVATSLPVPVVVKNGLLILAPQDTSLNINANNYSGDQLLTTYTWPDFQPANAVLMKFDLSSVPPGSIVHDATLLLSLVQSDATVTETYNVTASKVIGRNPVIQQATGYLADAATGWTPSACCHEGVPLAQSDISPAYATVAVDAIPGVKSWPITPMVQEWLADSSSNFGLLLNSDTTKPRDRYRFFASMEHPVAALRPMLRVTYSTEADNTPPTVAITAPGAGQTVTNVTAITASASDNAGVSGVQLHLDGAPLGAELTAPYTFDWDTRSVANGQHSLTAVARDASGNSTVSDAVGVIVQNDSTAPVISGVSVSGVTSSGATISWTTDEASDSQVEYGPTTAYGTLSSLDGSFAGAHSVTLSGLADATQYHFRVRSRDQSGNLATSADSTLTTLDGTAPAVSIVSPSSGATVSGTIAVTVNANDNVGVAGVQFKLDGVNYGAEDTTAPYSTSWNTTAVADGNHTLTATARDAAGNVRTATAITVTVANTTPPPPPPGAGIAAQYPGDAGIENHPNVVLVERFDESTMANLFAKWTDVLNGGAMSFSTDAPAGSPVGRSLNIPWSSGNTGGHLYKQLSQGIDDTLYVRYYVKYPTNNDYSHNGMWMGGNNPPLSWPNPQAGTRPTGSDRFIASAEQNTQTNRFDHYDYWMGMRQSSDGNYWGNLLLNNPNVQADAGQWTCVEQMVKLNNPVSASNGEHAIWLNGVKVSHLGQGFPNGNWSGGIFTQDPNGSPFPGFQWRNTTNLNLNWIWLQIYATNGSGALKYAHVVAAKSYIGCLASGGSPSPPPTVSITSPAAGATVSGTTTVSANAADDVGVAGVQFKLNGANLGAEDTTAPYSVAWNTTTSADGSHVITAVARDGAGNSTTSATVTVMVSNAGGAGSWPNDPPSFLTATDQPWNAVTGNGWNYLRRSASKNADIVADASAPFSLSNTLRMIFTTDMNPDSEPGVHWLGLPGIKEVYTGWWMKMSPNWECSPAGCGKVTFLFTNGAGQVYTGVYHSAQGGGPPYRIAANTEWAPYGQRIWYPNVVTTPVSPGEWHRIEFYYRWESVPGVSGDGIIRWWVDGVLNGDYTNVRYPNSSFVEFQYAPTLQNPPSAEQYMYIDHTRIRRP
jgi:chitodextrinase